MITSPFLSLPTELQLVIAVEVPPSAIFYLRSTCSKVHALYCSDYLWKSKICHDFSLDSTYVDQTKTQSTWTKEYQFYWLLECSPSDFEDFLHRCFCGKCKAIVSPRQCPAITERWAMMASESFWETKIVWDDLRDGVPSPKLTDTWEQEYHRYFYLEQERLWDACNCGDTETVSTLVQHGMNPNFQLGFFNETPLMMAIQKKHDNIALLLVDHGARVDTRDRMSRTALHLALHQAPFPRKVCDRLMQANPTSLQKMDWNAPLTNRRPLLMNLAQVGTLDAITWLLDLRDIYHLNVNVQDGLGWTPLMVAVQRERTAVAQLLLRCGADPTIQTYEGEDLETFRTGKYSDLDGISRIELPLDY